ncbi:60S ribosomal export protein NMD3 [Methanohalobium sp.]|uniref:60S ribosomal export protein NMD3 n=1 Tax=Methanohalobium sp. TaxID=2837493 RepID=UPI0025CC6E07|nr:60S ribosomal export protein NMD3 [Methanohalobium sp.]
MSLILCPKCGNETDVLYENVCKNCFFEQFQLARLPHVIHVKFCSRCGSVYYHGVWDDVDSTGDMVVRMVEDELMVHEYASDLEIYFEPQQLTSYMYRVRVIVDARVEGVPVNQEVETEVRIGRESCDRCSRIAGGYFEGIVQIRGTNRVPDKNEVENCIRIANDVIDRMYKKGERFAFISKSVESKHGIDLYIGSSNTSRQICKQIESELGGKFSESPTLFGQKDGKEIYRVTFSMRLPEFKAGDIIEYKDRVIEIKNSGNRVSGNDLSNGTRFVECQDKMSKAVHVASRDDAITAVLVSEGDNEIMVLDPETYKTLTLKKPVNFESGNKSEIPVIKTEDGLFVLSD